MLVKIWKFIVVGIGLFSGPGILFLLPYILQDDSYATFAKVLAISQLISTIGGAGLEVACPRLRVNFMSATKYAIISGVLASIVVYSFFTKASSDLIILASISAISNNLPTIYQSYFIFAGRAKQYGLIGVIRATVIVVTLMAFIRTGIDAASAWTMASFCGALVVVIYGMHCKNSLVEKSDNPSWKEVFQFALPMAVIYGAATMPFIMDRVIAQEYLDNIEFARYAVALTWAVPIIYLGNIFQQYMLGDELPYNLKAFLKKFFAIIAFGSLYSALILIALSLGLSIPYFPTAQSFVKIWGYVAFWYTLYSAFAFPTAALIQKLFTSNDTKTLAITTVVVTPLALLVSWLVAYDRWNSFGIHAAVLFAALFAFLSLSPRVYFTCKKALTR